jgi:hypothetical protein
MFGSQHLKKWVPLEEMSKDEKYHTVLPPVTTFNPTPTGNQALLNASIGVTLCSTWSWHDLAVGTYIESLCVSPSGERHDLAHRHCDIVW